MESRTLVLAIVFGMGACTRPAEGPTDVEVAEVVIARGDTLEISGLGRDGSLVGRITVSYGRYFDDERGEELEGTIIDLTAHGQYLRHTSVGRSALQLPIPGSNDRLHAFMLDHRFQPALRDWNIEFVGAVELEEERSYHSPGGSCTYSAPCGPYECNEYPNPSGPPGAVYQDVCCPVATAAQRSCTSPGAKTGCGIAGTNGCAVCWTQPGTGCSINSYGYFQTCSHNGGPCTTAEDCCFDGGYSGYGLCSSGICLEE